MTHAWYRFYAFVRHDRLAKADRDRILQASAAQGLPVFSGSCSDHRKEIFSDPDYHPVAPLPVAQELGETSLAFLVDPTWRDEELDYVGNTLLEISRMRRSRGIDIARPCGPAPEAKPMDKPWSWVRGG